MATTDEPRVSEQLPSPTHEVIVLLEGIHLTLEDLDTTPRTHELISYYHVAKPQEIRERVQCASIVVTTQAPITSESLGEAPYLKYVIVPGVGTNHIDLDECRRRGIRVANSPGSTSPAVSEHALSLYFAARRKTVTLHNVLGDVDENGQNLWKRTGSAARKMTMANGNPPTALCQEVAGIFGYGIMGKRLATFCDALGMKVLISERKMSTTSVRDDDRSKSNEVTRTPFDEVIRSATVLFITCPLTPETENMLDTPEFEAMRPEAVVVNVGRGAIVNSAALVRALREKRISGAAVDVYDKEPASSSDDSLLLAENAEELNITFSPHVGYFSGQTVLTIKRVMREHIRDYVTGTEANFVV